VTRAVPVRGNLKLKFDDAGRVSSVEWSGEGARRFWEALLKQSKDRVAKQGPAPESGVRDG
jgi:hypothetical protein